MFLIGFENRCTKLLMIDCPTICLPASLCLSAYLSVLIVGICTWKSRAVFPHCVGKTSHTELSDCTHLYKCTATHTQPHTYTSVLTDLAAVVWVHFAALCVTFSETCFSFCLPFHFPSISILPSISSSSSSPPQPPRFISFFPAREYMQIFPKLDTASFLSLRCTSANCFCQWSVTKQQFLLTGRQICSRLTNRWRNSE